MSEHVALTESTYYILLSLYRPQHGYGIMQQTERLSQGRVRLAAAGGVEFSGTQLRQKLGLNSAAISWLVIGDQISFFCVGYGHGVGMCQYGAAGMAAAEWNYADILAHYYPGTELLPYVGQ